MVTVESLKPCCNPRPDFSSEKLLVSLLAEGRECSTYADPTQDST